MVAMHTHSGTEGGSISPPNDFIGDAGNAVSHLSPVDGFLLPNDIIGYAGNALPRLSTR